METIVAFFVVWIVVTVIKSVRYSRQQQNISETVHSVREKAVEHGYFIGDEDWERPGDDFR